MDTLSEIDATGFAAAKALDLAFAYARRNRANFRNYADLLYARILEFIHPHKNKILEQMITAVETPGSVMRVKIWDYSVTYPTDGNRLPVYDAIESSKKGNHTVLFDDEKPMSVDAIFRNSDLRWRIACTFGTKFRVSCVQEDTKAVSQDYSSYRIGVYLHYHPEGLDMYSEKCMVDAYKAVCDRQLYANENSYMPPRN